MAETVTADPQSDPFTFGQQALFATFTGSPTEQMVYSVIAATAAYVSSTVSFGATLVFGFLFTATFFVGLTRFVYSKVAN